MIQHSLWLAASVALATTCASAHADTVSAAKLIAAGNERYQAGNIAEALRAYEQALEADPHSATALYNLAMARLATDDPQSQREAVGLLRRVAGMTGVGPLAQRAQFNLGVLESREADRLLDAATSVQSAIAQDAAPTLDDVIAAYGAAAEQFRSIIAQDRARSATGQPSADLLRAYEYARRRQHDTRQLKQTMEAMSSALRDARDQLGQQAEALRQSAERARTQQDSSEQHSSDPHEHDQQPDGQPDSSHRQQQQGSSGAAAGVRSPQATPQPPDRSSGSADAPSPEDLLDALNEAIQRASDALQQSGALSDADRESAEAMMEQARQIADQLLKPPDQSGSVDPDGTPSEPSPESLRDAIERAAEQVNAAREAQQQYGTPGDSGLDAASSMLDRAKRLAEQIERSPGSQPSPPPADTPRGSTQGVQSSPPAGTDASQQPEGPADETSMGSLIDALNNAIESVNEARNASQQAGVPDDPRLDATQSTLDQARTFAEQVQRLLDEINKLPPEQQAAQRQAIADALQRLADAFADQVDQPADPPDQPDQGPRDAAQDNADTQDAPSDQNTDDDAQPPSNAGDTDSLPDASPPDAQQDGQSPQDGQDGQAGEAGQSTDQASDQQSGTPSDEQQGGAGSGAESDAASKDATPEGGNAEGTGAAQAKPDDGRSPELEAMLREILNRETQQREALERYRRQFQPSPRRVEKDW